MGIKDKTIKLIERQLTKKASVLETRTWQGGTFYEVDLHLPEADLGIINGVAHLKCRVAPLTFRDYTIAQWDEETKTCTLFVDAAHDGAGSAWVKLLNQHDEITYLKIEKHRYPLKEAGNYLFLGDQSTVGHFLALRQLIGKNASVNGSLVIPDPAHRRELTTYYPHLGLEPVGLSKTSSAMLKGWLSGRSLLIYDFVFLAGSTEMVVDIRDYLRSCGVAGSIIKAHGFWH
jgi:NADPH-dependent ferric siderophore reductase